MSPQTSRRAGCSAQRRWRDGLVAGSMPRGRSRFWSCWPAVGAAGPPATSLLPRPARPCCLAKQHQLRHPRRHPGRHRQLDRHRHLHQLRHLGQRRHHLRHQYHPSHQRQRVLRGRRHRPGQQRWPIDDTTVEVDRTGQRSHNARSATRRWGVLPARPAVRRHAAGQVGNVREAAAVLSLRSRREAGPHRLRTDRGLDFRRQRGFRKSLHALQ